MGEGKGAESALSFQTCHEHQAQKACKTPIVPALGACSLWIIQIFFFFVHDNRSLLCVMLRTVTEV